MFAQGVVVCVTVTARALVTVLCYLCVLKCLFIIIIIIIIPTSRVYFRPLKKGAVLPIAIVKKKGVELPLEHIKTDCYSLNVLSITNKTNWFL